MKRTITQATVLAYIGALLLLLGFYPAIDDLVDKYPLLHGMWHVEMFIGAGLLVYGLETLRSFARRHRRMIQ